MSDAIELLKTRKPEIGAFLEMWRQRHEGHVFELKEDAQQADFYEAMVVLVKHIAHASKNVSLKTIVSADGVTTVYLNVTPTSPAS